MKSAIYAFLAFVVLVNLMSASVNLFIKNDRVIGLLHLNLAVTISAAAFLAERK